MIYVDRKGACKRLKVSIRGINVRARETILSNILSNIPLNSKKYHSIKSERKKYVFQCNQVASGT
jgi:hypothetical protein